MGWDFYGNTCSSLDIVDISLLIKEPLPPRRESVPFKLLQGAGYKGARVHPGARLGVVAVEGGKLCMDKLCMCVGLSAL